jgi:alpha-aminoadipic semialdehyde synthase
MGATVTEDLSPASLILGVKQVKIKDLIPNKNYLFFSHVIKAQPENMPLLDDILAKNIRLFDYETITEGSKPGGPRLVAFGKYAGIAGMIDTLQGLGQRLLLKGINSPFLTISNAYTNETLE